MNIMSLLLWGWFFSVVISIYTDIKSVHRIFKKIANDGFKFNPNRMANVEELSNNTDTNKITVLQWFCPYANLFWASQRQIQFKSYYEVLFSALKIMGAIESINEEELEEYTKNPTVTNLINISYQSFKHDKIEEK